LSNVFKFAAHRQFRWPHGALVALVVAVPVFAHAAFISRLPTSRSAIVQAISHLEPWAAPPDTRRRVHSVSHHRHGRGGRGALVCCCSDPLGSA